MTTRRVDLSQMVRPNWIEINLDGLAHNIHFFRARIPSHTKILLPVKADAYGHGSLACSWAAVKAGVDWLGVAHVFEGVLLRQYGIEIPILVLGSVTEADFPYLLDYSLTPSLSEATVATAFDAWLSTQHAHWQAHLKIDTGMHRFGFAHDDLDTLRPLLQLEHLRMEGMFSHLSTADMPGHPMTAVQVQRFRALVQQLTVEGLRPEICHLANSAGILNYPDTAFDMVRPGVALYGYHPQGESPSPLDLKPVMRMKATIRQIRTLPAGEAVSYGQFWRANEPTRVATVAIGYGDGYMRGEANQGFMFVHGQACPILGRVCMDATMIDISHVPAAKLNDTVDVIHGELDSRISLENIAARCHTISYEIATRVARRLYRKYHWNGQLLRWDELREQLNIPDFQESSR